MGQSNLKSGRYGNRKRFPTTPKRGFGSIAQSTPTKDLHMSAAIQLLNTIPATIKAIQENPLASVVVVVLGAFALVAYALYKLA